MHPTPLERFILSEIRNRQAVVNLSHLLGQLDVDYQSGWRAIRFLENAGRLDIRRRCHRAHGIPLEISIKEKTYE